MNRRTRIIVVTAAVVGAVAIGTGAAVAGGVADDDATETAITGAALERATAAALDPGGDVDGVTDHGMRAASLRPEHAH